MKDCKQGMCEENAIISEFRLVEFSCGIIGRMSGDYAGKCSHFLERVFRGEIS